MATGEDLHVLGPATYLVWPGRCVLAHFCSEFGPVDFWRPFLVSMKHVETAGFFHDKALIMSSLSICLAWLEDSNQRFLGEAQLSCGLFGFFVQRWLQSMKRKNNYIMVYL